MRVRDHSLYAVAVRSPCLSRARFISGQPGQPRCAVGVASLDGATLTVTYDGGDSCPNAGTGVYRKVVIKYTCGGNGVRQGAAASQKPWCPSALIRRDPIPVGTALHRRTELAADVFQRVAGVHVQLQLGHAGRLPSGHADHARSDHAGTVNDADAAM